MRKYILALLLVPTLAGAFQTEITGSFSRADYENDDEFTAAGLEVEYFFKPVEVNGHPYVEAAFLERSSSIVAVLGSSKFEFASGTSMDGPLYGARVTLMNKESPFYVSAGFMFAEYEVDVSPTIEMEIESYSINPGFFINDTSLIIIHFQNSETELLGVTSDGTEVGIGFKSVIKNINLEGSIEQSSYDSSTIEEDNTEISLNVDYYLSQKASVGAGISTNSGDDSDDEGNTFTLRSIIYSNENIGFGFEYEKFSADNGADENSITVQAGVRF